MKLSNLTIGARLYAGFAVVLAFCAGLALVAWLQVQRIGAIVTDINDSWVVSIVQLNEINDALSNVRRSELRSVLAVDLKSIDAEEAYRAEQFKRLEAEAKPYEATGISGPPEQKLYDQFRADLQSYQQSWTTLLPLLRGGAEQHGKAVEFLLGESKQRFDRVSAALRTDVKFNVNGVAERKNESYVALRTGATAIVLTWLAIVAVSLLFAWWVTRSIVAPLHAAVRVARNIATGDLSRSVDASGQDEAGQLLAALGDMQSKLRGTLGAIQESADQVGTASTQIASGNSDLSVRTEQQASSLQETASSIEQLTTTVTHSADSARQANALATSATRLAEEGGEVVGKVVDTMNGISTSSKRISDIIGVIDGIAFQTNILALNAAVEAARAGEQGRGFAVVASEVRTLAQRSAQAAKEIKTLIQDSVERVDAGGQLVQQAGTKMAEVVDSIRSVTVLISEVSTAASEQTSGIRLVNTSVNDLDKTTQQNAALVEESAAAAESLKEQALTLSRAVNQFRLIPA